MRCAEYHPYTKKDPLPKRFLLKLLRIIIRIYVEVFRGTPMVLQAVFIVYGLPYFTDNALRFDNIWTAAILIVSVNTGAYMAESVRGGIISIDPGQTEGAKAIGMNHWQTMLHVILPQALRNMVPALLSQFVTTIKDTSICGAPWLCRSSWGRGMILMNSYNSTVQIFAIFGLMALIYFVVCFTLSQIVRAYQRRLKGAR